ncbi:MAG TPA: DUF2442 domain-containing protein [Armatimonadota bacterium]|nr:DUF2442 domain-containing protein [Armatimonadota bacterium]
MAITKGKDIDTQIAAALDAGELADRTEPRAVSAHYDARKDRLVVRLRNDVELAVPRRLLQGLQGATERQLRDIRILGDGYALRWDSLDADFTVPGLANSIFGTRAWMARISGGTRGGSKAAAAHANGLTDSRPRKNSSTKDSHQL